MRKVLKIIAAGFGLLIFLYFLNWIIAGFPRFSKEGVIEKVKNYYFENENRKELDNLILLLKSIKNNYPGEELKIEASVKQLEAKIYKKKKYDGIDYFDEISWGNSYPSNFRNFLVDHEIYYIILKDNKFIFRLRSSFSSASSIYLIYSEEKSSQSGSKKIKEIPNTDNETNWTYSINEYWVIKSKEL